MILWSFEVLTYLMIWIHWSDVDLRDHHFDSLRNAMDNAFRICCVSIDRCLLSCSRRAAGECFTSQTTELLPRLTLRLSETHYRRCEVKVGKCHECLVKKVAQSWQPFEQAILEFPMIGGFCRQLYLARHHFALSAFGWQLLAKPGKAVSASSPAPMKEVTHERHERSQRP